MAKTYECMVLLDNREVRQGWEPLKQAVTGMFEKYGAEVVSARRWDERRLAYPIEGQTRGTYLLVYYSVNGDANTGIRRDLELSEQVLRHMIVTCDEIPASAHEPEAAFDFAAIPEEDEPPASAARAAAGESEDAVEVEPEAAEPARAEGEPEATAADPDIPVADETPEAEKEAEEDEDR